MTALTRFQEEMRAIVDHARIANALPICIELAPSDVAHVRGELAYLGLGEAEILLVERDPIAELATTARHAVAMRAIALAGVLDTPYGGPPRATERPDAINARADELLARYRHNDPEAASRIRAERLARKRSRP